MPFGRANLTYKDYNNEGSQTGFRGVLFTAANFDTQMGKIDTLQTAVEAVTLCNLVKSIIVASESNPGAGPSANPQAQRELKWLVRMYDTTTGRSCSVQIPGADTSLLLPNSDKMDPASAGYTNLVAAVEDYHLSIEGNAVEVIDIIMVGRNL
jgi:hypothetical protein